jgi:outer membrane protein TolC
MNRWMTILAFVLATSLRAQEPLDLREAASRALTQGAAAQVARAQLEEARAGTRLASDTLHPQLLVSSTPGYASGLTATIAGQLPALVTVTAMDTFYDPSRRADILRARAREASARGALGESRTRVVQDVIQAYAKVWLQTALLRSALAREAAQEALADETAALVAEGRVLALDGERAQLARARAKQQRLDVESDRDLDALELVHLMGGGGAPPTLPEDLLQSLPEPVLDGALEAAQRTDPQSLAFGPAIEATEAARRVRERRFLPVVQGQALYARLYHTASYDLYYPHFQQDDWNVGLSVVVPVFQGGRGADAALEAQAVADRLRHAQRARETELELGVRRAMENVGRSRARTSLARRAESIAEEALAVTAKQRAEGRAGVHEMAGAASALADARDEVARAVADELVARGDLLALRGDLLASLGLQPSP